MPVQGYPATGSQLGVFPDANRYGGHPGGDPAPPAVTPLTILGASRLIRWLESDMGIVLNGSNVSDWNDQSGNGNHFVQGTALSQPLYVASGGPSNKAYIDCDGVDDYLDGVLSIAGPSAASPTTIIAIIRQPTWTSNKDPISGQGAGANLAIRQLTSTPSLGMANPTAVNANSGLALNTWGLVTAQFTNSVADYVQIGSAGVPVTGANAGSSASSMSQRLGTNRAATSFSDVECAMLCYVRGIITPAEFSALYSYWTAKYGVA